MILHASSLRIIESDSDARVYRRRGYWGASYAGPQLLCSVHSAYYHQSLGQLRSEHFLRECWLADLWYYCSLCVGCIVRLFRSVIAKSGSVKQLSAGIFIRKAWNVSTLIVFISGFRSELNIYAYPTTGNGAIPTALSAWKHPMSVYFRLLSSSGT